MDADGHLCEPADLWERGLPSHLADQGIRLRWDEETGYDSASSRTTWSSSGGSPGSATPARASTTSVAAATTKT